MMTVLSKNPGVVLKWKCDVPNNKVHFEISGQSDGWVALGISRAHGMVNMDIVAGGIHEGAHHGHVCYRDMWASSYEQPKGNPPEEASQDLSDVSVKAENGWTHLKFSKNRKDFMSPSGASAGDLAIEEGEELYVNWALGAFDSAEHCKILQHDPNSRGDERMVLCPRQSFPNTKTLTPDADLKWSKTKGHLVVEISAMTDGWVGFGFSPTGSMLNADIFTAYVKNGLVHIQDRHSGDQYAVPMEDVKNDWELLEGSFKDGRTTIRARRSLLGDGSSQDIRIRGTMKVIWAYGSVGDDIEMHKQDTRGSAEIDLYPMPSLQNLIDRISRLEKRLGNDKH